MTCTLRAIGRVFDVDAFLETSSLRGQGVYRKGDAFVPEDPERQTRAASGFSVSVTSGETDDPAAIMDEIIGFLSDNEEELRRLGSYEGVEEVCLEVLTRCSGAGMEIVVLPADLLWRAGALDIDLVMTHLGERGIH